MAYVLLVSDARTVLDDLRAVVDTSENEVVECYAGQAVRKLVSEDPPDLVIADSQIQNMGGIAVCHDLKLEESAGRIPHMPVLLILDRRADVFLARRCMAEGYLVKPLDPIRLRHATEALLSGETYYDKTYVPFTVEQARNT